MFQAFLFLEASRKAFLSQRTFVKHTLPRLRRKAAQAAEAAAVTSTSVSPDISTNEEARAQSIGTGFDFAEVDREVAADAHEVDERGNAEEASLPPTPHSEDVELPADSEFDEGSYSDEESRSRGSSSPSQGTPRRRSPALGPSTPPSRDASQLGDADEAQHTPRLSAVERESAMDMDRPRPPPLRPSASARDVSSSTATSEPSSKVSSPTSRRRSATVALPNSRSVGSSPRNSLVPLSPREIGERARRLHARTNSHPEIQTLLQSLRAAEDTGDRRLKTRIWNVDRSGPPTPLESLQEGYNPYEDLLSQDG